MVKEKLTLRYATIEDCDLLFKWANDKETRKNAFSTEPIPYDTHVKWFNNKMKSDNCKILILQMEDIPIGLLRLDYENDTATISYSIDSDHRGKGFGKEIVLQSYNYFLENNKGCKYLKALVKYENIASQKIFEKLDFEKIEEKHNLKYLKKI